VPFPLGRPFGVPNNRDFQTDVLHSLLAVFRHEAGPVIDDFPHDAPASDEGEEPWSCVLPLPPLPEATTAAERLIQALVAEVTFLLPWHAESVRRRGRTLFGLTGRLSDAAPELAAYLAAFAAGETPELTAIAPDSPASTLRMIVDDLKTFYLEAAAAQPGMSLPDPYALNRWLYHETRLGDVLYRIRDRLAAETEAIDPQNRPPPVAIIPNMYRNRPARESSKT
jgi:hypothetical protein